MVEDSEEKIILECIQISNAGGNAGKEEHKCECRLIYRPGGENMKTFPFQFLYSL